MNALFALITLLCGVLAAPLPQDAAEGEVLVERIKQQLSAVDRALQEAADADAVSNQIADARAAHLAVIRDIESLIKQVKYQRSQQGSGGGGKPPPSSNNSPPPPPRESDADNAPEPGKDGQPQPPEQPQSDGEQPKGGQPDAELPRDPTGGKPPPPETSPFTREDTDARWGLLPPKMQERLMNLHVDDIPERYRSWMDAYIRELNRLEQGSGRP